MRTRHFLAELRDAEAAFVGSLPAFGVNDLRIDEHDLRLGIFLECDIDDRDALANADLRSCQPDAVRGIHALEHVVDELAQFVVELGDGGGLLLQNRVAKFHDRVDHLEVSQLLTISFVVSPHFGDGVAAKLFQGQRAMVSATMASAATPAAGTTQTSERS